jgi:uncharacterized protein YjbJ (UPF0337 family)
MGQQLRGKAKRLEGRVVETAGVLTGDSALARKGSRMQTTGALQEGVGKARQEVGDLVATLAKAARERKTR